MKKKLLGAIALGLCVFGMAGCDLLNGFLNNSSTPAAEPDFASVRGYLLEAYEPYEEGRIDYEVTNQLPIGDFVYELTWSIEFPENVTANITAVRGEETTTIDVDEASTVEVEYYLVATVKVGDVTAPNPVKIPRVLTAISEKVTAAITSKPEENVAYKLYVYQSTKKADYYFNGKMSSHYYGTSEKVEEGVDVYAEHKANSETEFYLYFGKGEDKQYLTIQEGWNSTTDHWTFNPVFTDEATTAFVYSTEYKTIVTTVFARSEADYSNKNAEPSTDTVVYLGNYSTHVTFSASNISYFGGEGNNVGKLVGLVDRNSVAVEDKVAATAKEISFAKTYIGDTEMTLADCGTAYPEAKITWTATGATITNNVLTVANPSATTEVKLTATVNCGNAKETKEITINVIPNTAEAIVAATKTLANNEAFGNNATLSGMITKVDTAYSADYANITVTIDVNGTAIQCYRLSGTGADKLAAGYTITVTGIIKNYNGKIEFDQGCTLVSYEEGTLPEAPVEEGTATISFSDKANRTAFTTEQQVWEQNGIKVTNNKGASTSDVADYAGPARFYKSSQLIIEYTGMKQIVFECNDYKATYPTDLAASISGAEVVVNGTTVTVTFAEATNKFTIETLNGQVRVDEIKVSTKASTVTPENPPAGGGETPPAGDNLTGTAVLDALYALADGESVSGTYQVTGVITNLDSYNNPTIVVDGDTARPVYCYKLKDDRFVVGATITVSAATLKNYGGTYELMDCTLVSIETGTTPPADNLTGSAVLDALYALADGESVSGTYQVTGVITNLDSYNNPTIVVNNDSARPVYCYKLKDDRFVVGATITVSAATLKNYGGTYELMDCTLVSIETGNENPPAGGDEPLTTSTIATIIAAEVGEYQAEGVVVGVNAKSFLLKDSTGMMLVYLNAMPNVAIGDKVTVAGTTTTYGGAKQFGAGATVTKNGTETVAHGDAKALTAAECDAYATASSITPIYATVTGTLAVSGNYFNLAIKDATIVGSLTYLLDADKTAVTALNGKEIKVTGYVTGVVSEGKYLNFLVTEYSEVTSEGGEVTPPAHEHVFVEGKCECGEEDPNYVPPTGGDEEPTTSTLVTAPVKDTAYHFAFTRTTGEVFYFAGTLDSQGFYLQATDDFSKSVQVYLEETTGGYYLYFLNSNNVKSYIEMYITATGYKNVKITTDTPASVYTYNTEYNTLISTLSDGNVYFLGSRNTFTTFSCSDFVKYVATNYVAHFYTGTASETPDEGGNETPDVGGDNEESTTVGLPVEGQAYYLKAVAYTAYAQEVSSNGKYIVTGATASTLTFYFEKVEGTTNQYYIKLSTGKYLNSASSGNYIAVGDTATSAWIIDIENQKIQLASDTQYYLQYNANSGQERISRYKGTQNAIWFEAVPAEENA